jgi:glutathione S-transferase
MITVSAFAWVPPFARGLVRDLRVRWALEEVGLAYQTKLIDAEDKKSAAYRAMQPFGQVPFYQEDDLVLFESGAILLHIAAKSDVLMPADATSRAQVTAWMFAAVNTIEPYVANLTTIDLFNADQEWAKARRPAELEKVQTRLSALTQRLGARDYLETSNFTVADLLMTTVLRIPRHCDLLAQYPALDTYRQRCEARPAFKRALDAQMADFVEQPPAAA